MSSSELCISNLIPLRIVFNIAVISQDSAEVNQRSPR
jgi:hypothetical protein